MLQRGRKSVAALSVVTPISALPRLRPPEGLSEGEASLFRTIVAQAGADHFVDTDVPLIVAYVQAILLTRWAFKAMGEEAVAFQTWQQAARTMATLATKLRLCPHSRTDPKTVTRRAGGVGVSFYDTMEDA
jgi:hypothetical protein